MVDENTADTEPIRIERVLEDELEEIKKRRSMTGQSCDEDEVVPRNLVGLALSGGGLRSASFSLGVLQAFGQKKMLKLVDYLSTVSGGGFAGAHLSSWSLDGMTRRRSQTHATDPQQPTDAENCPDESYLETEPYGKQPLRMRRFLYGGDFLKQTWLFSNKYLFGLLLLWLVIFSALIAATSLIAFLFRSLDYLEVRLFFDCVGFDGDLAAAFFPTFVVFGVWAMFWGISYFKYGRRATGACARFMFYLLVLITAVAVAALLGTGEINVASMTHFFGLQLTDSNMEKVESGLRMLFFTTIGASLLPLFTFRRLLRSGQEPRRPAERYAFWIATRALAYGIPFLLIAYFAQENISKYNDRRDARLYRGDVKQWSLDAPLWRQVALSLTDSDTNSENKQPQERLGDVVEQERLGDVVEQERVPGLYLAFQGLQQYQIGAQETSIEAHIHKLHEDGDVPKLLSEPDDGLYATNEGLYATDDVIVGQFELSFPQKWWYVMRWGVDWVFGHDNQILSNPIRQQYHCRKRTNVYRNQVTAFLNESLANEDFVDILLPLDNAAPSEVSVDAFAKSLTDEQEALKKRLKAEVAVQRNIEDPDVWADNIIQLWRKAQTRKHLHKHLHKPLDDSDEYKPKPNTKTQIKRQVELLKEEREVETIALNRQLLAAFFPGSIGDKDTVYFHKVHVQDQQARWNWFVRAFVIFIAAGLLVDLNFTSWHGYYAGRIAEMWIDPVPGFGDRIPLARLETVSEGYPYHLINASVHLVGRRDDTGKAPAVDHFLFSQLYCGSHRLRFSRTEGFLEGKLQLGDVVAMSGAAVTPFRPTNPLVVALLILFNVRLGQWLPNPEFRSKRLPKWFDRLPVTPLRVMAGFGYVAQKRRFCFVADGGHHENTGISPLLQRRCELIIASDASQDEGYHFEELMRVIRENRILWGIEFEPLSRTGTLEPDLKSMTPDKDSRRADKSFMVARIRYPGDAEPKEGLLVYLKPALCGNEAADLQQFQAKSDEFPHDPTSDQFYDATRFEAYRQLGEHIANGALEEMLGDTSAVPSSVVSILRKLRGEESLSDDEEPRTVDADNGSAKERIAELLQEICSDDSKTREEATSALSDLGEDVIDGLEVLIEYANCKPLDPDKEFGAVTAAVDILDRYPRQVLEGLKRLFEGTQEPDVITNALACVRWCLKDGEQEAVGLREQLFQIAREHGTYRVDARVAAIEIIKENASQCDPQVVKDFLLEIKNNDPSPKVQKCVAEDVV